MSKRLIIILIIFISMSGFAKRKTTGNLSFYYSMGNYTNSANTNAFSLYTTISFNQWDSYSLGIDALTLSSDSLNYSQFGIVGSAYLNFYPFYLKLAYLNISGSENVGRGYGNSASVTSDMQHLFSIEGLMNWENFYFGLGSDYSIISGYEDLSLYHISSKITWVPSLDLSLSIKPILTKTDDYDNRFYVSAEVNYLLLKFLVVNLRGGVGERIFYFDSDYLTFFNQAEVQKRDINSSLTFLTTDHLNIKVGYVNTIFETFDVDYYYAGIKYFFY